jgi:Zn-dependent protease
VEQPDSEQAPLTTAEPQQPAAIAQQAEAQAHDQERQRPLAAPTPILKRIVGPVIAAGAALVKWGAVIFKLKVFTFAASMAVSLAAYAWIWGWQFALGFIVLLFVHEMGHVIALRRMGIPASLPMFIPFLGAFVTMKEQPKTAWHEAVSGIAGPVTGSLGALACWWYASTSGSTLFQALAFTGFFLNLFNLIPIVPLDGGRTAAAIHPAMWVVGLIGLIGLAFYTHSPLVIIIAILGATEAWRRFRGRNTAESKAYYQLTPQQRQIITVAYLGLVALLVLAMHATYIHRTFN